MIAKEINFFGLLIPTLVPLFILCFFGMWFVDRRLHHLQIYAKVAHPALFRLSLFVILFSAVGLLIY